MNPLLSLDAGVEQRDLGLYATELNNSDFLALARSIACLISAERGSVTIDEVRAHPNLQHWQPSSTHTWGAVFHHPGFKVVGQEPSKVKTNRARRVYRWEWRP